MQSIEKSLAWEPNQESIKTPAALYQKAKFIPVCVGGGQNSECVKSWVIVCWWQEAVMAKISASDSWEMVTPFQRDRKAFLLTMWRCWQCVQKMSATVPSLQSEDFSVMETAPTEISYTCLCEPTAGPNTLFISVNKQASLCSCMP